MHAEKFLVHFIIILCVFAFGCNSNTHEYPEKQKVAEYNQLFQYSVITALQQGVFDTDEFTCGQLKKHGNIGLGTFNALDGELILLDENVYQATSGGEVKNMPDDIYSPFAACTYFKADTSFIVKQISEEQFQRSMTGVLQQNEVYAFKITGGFDTLKFRSVPKQIKPYSTLSIAAKNQTVFSMQSQQGTIIGFFSPEYLSSANVTGYHFHFLNKEKNKGGHILRFFISEATIEIARMKSVQIVIPGSKEFSEKDILGADKNELYKAEH